MWSVAAYGGPFRPSSILLTREVAILVLFCPCDPVVLSPPYSLLSLNKVCSGVRQG